MNKIDFYIVALPKADDIEKLNKLRNYFYVNNFRYANKPNKSDAHITLAQGICEEFQIDSLRSIFESSIKNWKPFKVSYTRITSDKRGPVPGKCEYENAWVALLFDDQRLRKLSEQIDSVLDEQKMSVTSEYVSKIVTDLYSGENLNREVIANHINLCNYCRPEKAKEAVALIENKAPKEITIDRIAYRMADASLAWIIDI